MKIKLLMWMSYEQCSCPEATTNRSLAIRRFCVELLTLLLLLTSVPLRAQKVFYIYRNDGCINSFLTAEIDSMVYSQIDLDSILHDEIVVHEVYTADSIYRIPLEVIDSVSFFTPETVYQPGVKVIEGEMRNHILSRDELTLVFDASTPRTALPVVGDKLVSTTGDEILESAFVGQVSEILNTENGIEIVCEPVALTDVFETYYSYSSIAAYRNAREAQSRKALDVPQIVVPDLVYEGDIILRPGPFSYDLLNSHNLDISYNPNDNLAFGVANAEISVSFEPVFRCHAFTIISKTHGVNIEVRIIGDYTLEQKIALSGHLNDSKDFSFFDIPLFKNIKHTIPIPEALIDFVYDVGISVNAQADGCIEQQWKQQFKHTILWNWSSQRNAPLKNVHNMTLTSKEHTGKVAIDGSLGIGFYLKGGICFIATSQLDIAEVGLKAEAGVKLEGTYVPFTEDFKLAKTSTDLYNKIKPKFRSTFV